MKEWKCKISFLNLITKLFRVIEESGVLESEEPEVWIWLVAALSILVVGLIALVSIIAYRKK